MLIAGLRVIGIFGFAFLTGYFVIQDSYLEATISVVMVLAWIAVTTEAVDLVLGTQIVVVGRAAARAIIGKPATTAVTAVTHEQPRSNGLM